MNMLTMTAFLLVAFCILKNAAAQDLRTTCPANGFEEGVQSQVNCSVNRSFFDTKCPSSPLVVSFAFGGSSIPWCFTDYQNCTTTGSPYPACNGCNCGCIDDTTSIFIYSLTFVPDSSYNGGSFTCGITCFGQNPTNNFTSCEQVSVAKDATCLTEEEKAALGGGVFALGIGSCAAVAYIVLRATMIFVHFTIAEENVPTLERKIKDMKGVSIRPINPEEQEKYKESNYVIEISKLSKDQKQIRTELKALIVELGGQISSDELQAIEDAAESPMPQPKYTGKGNGQQKKSKSDKEIPLSTVGRSSPPSETSGDEKTHMIPAKTGTVPTNQLELTSIGIGNSASQRLEPLKTDRSKMPSVERNSDAFSRDLPSPRQQPLEPIPSGKMFI